MRPIKITKFTIFPFQAGTYNLQMGDSTYVILLIRLARGHEISDWPHLLFSHPQCYCQACCMIYDVKWKLAKLCLDDDDDEAEILFSSVGDSDTLAAVITFFHVFLV